MCAKWSIFLFIFLLFISVQAKAQDEYYQASIPEEKQERTFFGGADKIGFVAGVGSSHLKTAAFNERLMELNVGEIDEFMVSRTLSILFGLPKSNDYITWDFNWSDATENVTIDPNYFLNLQTFSIGMTGHKSLLRYRHNRRFDLYFVGGYRYNDMHFEYNSNRIAISNFDSLFVNSAVNSRVIRMSSRENMGILVGSKAMVRLGKKESVKPWTFNLGIESGYTFHVKINPWRETGSRRVVANMPVLKPDNFYFHLLTFSGHYRL